MWLLECDQHFQRAAPQTVYNPREERAMDDLFQDADIISVYTREDAIRDGVLVRLDVRASGEPLDICFTANLWAVYGADDIHRLRTTLIMAGLTRLNQPDPEDLPGVRKLRVIVEDRIWVVWDTDGAITFMRPEDY